MKKICNSNCVYNFQPTNQSSKMLMSKMIQIKSAITNNNSRVVTYYKIILSLDYSANKQLLLALRYKLYMQYANNTASCGVPNPKQDQILYMVEYIISNLTLDEKDLIYNIIQPVIIPEPIIDVTTITNTFHVVTKTENNTFFIIKNYINETFSTSKNYLFNLEDPSNLDTSFCLSINQDGIPVDGITYFLKPGTPGARMQIKISSNPPFYGLFIFNKNVAKKYQYFWGYNNPFIPVSFSTPIYTISFIILPTESQCTLSVYEFNGPKYYIMPNNKSQYMNGSNNNAYSFYYGTYYLSVPKLYAVALLNNDISNNIYYSGDITKSFKAYISNTTSDGLYTFYYGIIKISVWGEFPPLSLYSYLYGYLNAYNTILFNNNAESIAQPEIRVDHDINNNIETVYTQTRVGIRQITLNNDVTYNSIIGQKYGIYNGLYRFYSSDPITFMNHGKENLVSVNSINTVKGFGPKDVYDKYAYTYYSGVITVQINGDFGNMSMYNFYEGNVNGTNILVYGEQYNSYYPPIISTINQNIIAEIPYIMPTNILPLIKYVKEITVEELRTNYIVTPKSLCNDISFVSNNVYEMTIGTYLFYSDQKDVAFMNNGKSEFITYTGIYSTKLIAPDNIPYFFYKTTEDDVRDTDKDTGQYLNTYTRYVYTCIVVRVTGDFGYLSVYRADGTLGQNLFKYKK